MAETDDYTSFLRRHIGMVGELDERAGHFTLYEGFRWHYGFYVLEAVESDYVRLRWNSFIEKVVPISRFAVSASDPAEAALGWVDLVRYHLGTKSRTKSMGWSSKASDRESAMIIYKAMNPGLSTADVNAQLDMMSAEVAQSEATNKSGGSCLILLTAMLGAATMITTAICMALF